LCRLLLSMFPVSRLEMGIWYEKLICPVPGYKTGTCNNLRLWGSKAASGEFDFQKFNSGEYESSVADQQRAETISAVLYPNDK
jgi:glucan phosphorylase